MHFPMPRIHLRASGVVCSCTVEGFCSLEGFGVVNNPYLIVYVCACVRVMAGLSSVHLQVRTCHKLCAKHPTPEVLEQPAIFSCK